MPQVPRNRKPCAVNPLSFWYACYMDDWLWIAARLLSERARNFSGHVAAAVMSLMNDSLEQQHCPSCKIVFFMLFAFPLLVFLVTQCVTHLGGFFEVFLLSYYLNTLITYSCSLEDSSLPIRRWGFAGSIGSFEDLRANFDLKFSHLRRELSDDQARPSSSLVKKLKSEANLTFKFSGKNNLSSIPDARTCFSESCCSR